MLCHPHFTDGNTEAHSLNGNLPKVVPTASTELRGGFQPRMNVVRDHTL